MQTGPTVGVNNRGDSHLIVYDEDNNIAYEFYRASRPSENSDGHWHADQESVWDMKTNTFRTIGWTSADAAGLPIFPGLARYEEAALGPGGIRHALRFTVQRTRRAYCAPAMHCASSNTSATLPPMGMRVRLKASYDPTAHSFATPIVALLKALQKYGDIV